MGKKTIDQISLETLKHYFSIIEKTGYYNYTDTNKILVLLFIRDFFTIDTANYITDEDYKEIYKTLYSMFGNTCAIGFPKLEELNATIGHENMTLDEFRYSEDDILRNTEDSKYRLQDK